MVSTWFLVEPIVKCPVGITLKFGAVVSVDLRLALAEGFDALGRFTESVFLLGEAALD